MALIERVLDSELPIIAGDDSRGLAESRADNRLNACRRFDLGELRGHVAVAGAVTLFMGDRDARFRRDRDALIAHRFAEGIRAGDQCYGRQLATLEIIED